jgi:hypothetical protein
MRRYVRNSVNIPDKWHEQPGPIPGLSEELSAQIKAQWKDRDRDDFAGSFDKGWAIATAAIERLSTDPTALKIKTFRDKYHAHLEMAPIGSDPGPVNLSKLGLTYQDVFGFVDGYMTPAFELVRVLTGQVHDIEGFAEVHSKNGSDMWQILAGLNDQQNA